VAPGARSAERRRRGGSNGAGGGKKKIVAVYDYADEHGKLVYQKVRFEPKDFRLRRPDGKGGWTWNMAGVKAVLYGLPELAEAKSVVFTEGEKDCETASTLGLVATTSGGVSSWQPGFAGHFRGKCVAILPDADEPGRKFARAVAADLVGVAASVRLADLSPHKDLSTAVEAGLPADYLREFIGTAPILTAADVAGWKVSGEAKAAPANPWDAAEDMDSFLSGEEGADFLEEPILARECLTEIFSPRGIGKTLIAGHLAAKHAKAGRKVLLIDRDNSRHTVKQRLRGFGVKPEDPNLKAISREKAPRLTDAAAWAQFPYSDYDIVILDSLDSATEGVGEQDSGKPSRAIAPLLDIARRDGGPAVLVLGNTIKSGSHSRGSGVVEDRADIVFEIRDATGFVPSGSKPWWEELPPADAASWASRASRRKGQRVFRLAFIASKFRVGEEPEPFILEIDLTRNPWFVSDVTDLVDQSGQEARETRRKGQQEAIERAASELIAEIERRDKAEELPLAKDRGAVPLLQAHGLTRAQARRLLNEHDGVLWRLERVEGLRGNPVCVLPIPGINEAVGANGTTTQAQMNIGVPDTPHLRRPHEQHTAQIPLSETPINIGVPASGYLRQDSHFYTGKEPAAQMGTGPDESDFWEIPL